MRSGADSVPLSGRERAALRARAHALKPVVWIAETGMTEGVMREIDRALDAHELIKIQAAGTDRETRAELLAAVCAALNAEPVQVIGRMLVLYRPRPQVATLGTEVPAKARKKPAERARPARTRREPRERKRIPRA